VGVGIRWRAQRETALQHAAVFGMTQVIDILAAAAKIHRLEQAAAAGDITGWPLVRFTLESCLTGNPRCLVPAADSSGVSRPQFDGIESDC
jgi:hypothetical protein